MKMSIIASASMLNIGIFDGNVMIHGHILES